MLFPDLGPDPGFALAAELQQGIARWMAGEVNAFPAGPVVVFEEKYRLFAVQRKETFGERRVGTSPWLILEGDSFGRGRKCRRGNLQNCKLTAGDGR
jgi:hypothetical protein